MLLFVLLSLNAWAIPEENYNRVWNTEVVGHFESMQQREFKNRQDMTIHYRFKTQQNANRTLVIFPGRSESMIKYAELMYDLQSSDLNIFIMDHQGQGESDRLLRKDASHVRRFSDYVNDAQQFMRDVVIPASQGTERVLLAHSMGAAIAVHYLKAKRNVFAKAVLSAPMLKINTHPYSETVALWYARVLILAGKGSDYAPGLGPYRPEADNFETNLTTHSRVRFESRKSTWINNPSLVVGDASVRWVKENIIGSKKSMKLARQIKTPLLILQAGQDQIVENSRQNTFCARVPQCHISLFPTARHEILGEKDEIRNNALDRIKTHLGL